MSRKSELFEIRKLLEHIETELGYIKESLNECFTKEERTVLAYEASVGRRHTLIEAMAPDDLKEYAAFCQEYLKFGREVDACLAGELHQQTAIRVGKIPDVLRHAGCEDMDMYITQKHLRNIVHSPLESRPQYHDIEVQQLKQLPELLSRPLAVLEDRRKPDTLVVVLDALDKQNRQIVVPVKMAGTAHYNQNWVDANFLLSVYGRERMAESMSLAASKTEYCISIIRAPV